MSNIVSKRLRSARLEVGISQKDLGIAAGIPENSASARMNQYETGKHAADFLTLKSIAKILKVPVAYFYAEEKLLADFLFLHGKMTKKDQKLFLADWMSRKS